MISGVESVLGIVLMIAVGFALAHKNWFDDSSTSLIVKLVTQISLPSLMLYTMVSNFTRKQFLECARGLIVPFLCMTICYILGIILSKVFNIRKSRRGLFVSLFFNSNTIFMGLPINEALFGIKSLPYVLLFYIANTTFFWTIGVYEINKDGINSSDVKLFSLETVKKIVSPPLMGYILGVFFILVGIHLPKFILSTCNYLGDLTTPLSMLFIGVTIYSVNIKYFKISKEMILICLGRFVVCPVTIILLTFIFPIPYLMKEVFVIQAAMPVMTNSAIIAKAYNADYKFAAVMISITTIASMIVIPIYMSIL